jgi:ParB family transcriptional regulator, chromosome partitioning protein
MIKLAATTREVFLAHCLDDLSHKKIAERSGPGVDAPGERKCAFHDHLGQLLGIDVGQWWRPTGANYFDRVPKSVTLATLRAVVEPAFASRHAGL